MTCVRGRGRVTLAISGAMFACVLSAHAADAPARFWNLTAKTIVDFRLAPAGTQDWGINQCVNDKDGAVDNDERLRLTGLNDGVYDAKSVDKDGRVCHARNIPIKPGAIFSLEEKDLVDCSK